MSKHKSFFTEILQHKIEFWYRDWAKFSGEMDEADEEHIKKMIGEGYNQGELNTYDHKNDTEHSGWWKIT